MRVFHFMVLVPDDIDPDEFTAQLAEGIPPGTTVQARHRPNATWDNNPLGSDVRFSMSTFNDGGPIVSQVRQSVRVWAHDDHEEEPLFITRGFITIQDGKPGTIRVSAGNGVYFVSDGEWTPTEAEWVVPARIESN